MQRPRKEKWVSEEELSQTSAASGCAGKKILALDCLWKSTLLRDEKGKHEKRFGLVEHKIMLFQQIR